MFVEDGKDTSVQKPLFSIGAFNGTTGHPAFLGAASSERGGCSFLLCFPAGRLRLLPREVNAGNDCKNSSCQAVTELVEHFVNNQRTVDARQDGERLVAGGFKMGEVCQDLKAQGLEDAVIEIDGIGCRREMTEKTKSMYGV